MENYKIYCNSQIEFKDRISFLLENGFVFSSYRFKTYEKIIEEIDKSYVIWYYEYLQRPFNIFTYKYYILIGNNIECSRVIDFHRRTIPADSYNKIKSVSFEEFVKFILPKFL